MTNEEIVRARATISRLSTGYGVLFALALLILVAQATFLGFTPVTMLGWAALIGSAVVVRLYGASLARRVDNAIIDRLALEE